MEFGLSLDPTAVTQRHTLYDSDEENGDAEEERDLGAIFSASSSQLKGGGALLVAVGQTAAIFVRSYFDLRSEPSCLITSETQEVMKDHYFPVEKTGASGDAPPTMVSEIYEAKSKSPESGAVYVCIHSEDLHSEYCNLWAQKLFQISSPGSILIITSSLSHEHLSSHRRDSNSFLRSLQTSVWCHPPLATLLEPPNTLKGEPAAVLTHCQVHSLSASAVVIYCSSSDSGTECVATLQAILSHPLIADNLSTKSEAEAIQTAKQLWPKPRQDLSTLYT